ncbi:MAG TPA: hypothetical protein VNO52_10545 [Methylomirabilota bacterium]|nr:hypothetical protein [Methylomirabilota bacterium]
MKTRLLLTALAAVAWPVGAEAASRSSANYTVPADTADAGGGRTTSASYSHTGSLGGFGGLSTAGPVLARHGYLGQIYDVTGLQVAASPNSVNEGATRQLTARVQLDDATTLVLDPNQVTWSVQSGPITSISPGGLASAGVVYENTAATVRGVYLGQAANVGLLVLNVNNDNFGGYAGDGLDDAWQVSYFGLNNPLANPSADADGDGQNNRFEHVANTIPTDAESRFRMIIDRVVGHEDRKAIVFWPRYPSRTYTVEHTADLAVGPFVPLDPITTTDNGVVRTVTDMGATDPQRTYRVRITFP